LISRCPSKGIGLIIDLKAVTTRIRKIIIDDAQFILTNEFIKRALEKGYDKFSEMAQHIWMIMNELKTCRQDLLSFILWHSAPDVDGNMKCKKVGKLLEDKIELESMVTCIFHTQVVEGAYKFTTQNNGKLMAKTPLGMFDEFYIDNDLQLVRDKIIEYSGAEPIVYVQPPVRQNTVAEQEPEAIPPNDIAANAMEQLNAICN
jgi:hypothetical protein